jgi:hypothetical protein
MEKKIFAFTDALEDVIAFEKLGFKSEIDDAINRVFYVEADLTDYDWLAVLGLLEDCERGGLEAILQYGEELIDWEDAIAYADKKAAEEHIND